jgi:hypothetical protein
VRRWLGVRSTAASHRWTAAALDAAAAAVQHWSLPLAPTVAGDAECVVTMMDLRVCRGWMRGAGETWGVGSVKSSPPAQLPGCRLALRRERQLPRPPVAPSRAREFGDRGACRAMQEGLSFISNRLRRGKKARNVRQGKVGYEPRTFGYRAKRFDQLR